MSHLNKNASNPDFEKLPEAMKQAREAAHVRAARCGGKVTILRDGKIVDIEPDAEIVVVRPKESAA